MAVKKTDTTFRFKQFEVDQDGCAMKINTDGVLLGAICSHPKPLHILDIGTGTGVIAMMLAQRFEQAKVSAVEIDAGAAARAGLNFSHSPFAGRMQVTHEDISAYNSYERFDLIVSNPPYFVNDLKNPEARKGIARHAAQDFFNVLLRKVAGLLHQEGQCWIILPVKQAQDLVVNAVLVGLYPQTIIDVHSDESKAAFRQIVCLSFANGEAEKQHLYIYESQGVYTTTYKQLLKDFFLAF